jgi:hypothetical protein
MHQVTVHDYMWNDRRNNLFLVGSVVFTAVTTKGTSNQTIANFATCFLVISARVKRELSCA